MNSKYFLGLCLLAISLYADQAPVGNTSDLKAEACALRKKIASVFREHVHEDDYPLGFRTASTTLYGFSQESVENVNNMFDAFEAFIKKQVTMQDEQEYFIDEIKKIRRRFDNEGPLIDYDGTRPKGEKGIDKRAIAWYHKKCLDVLKAILIFHG